MPVSCTRIHMHKHYVTKKKLIPEAGKNTVPFIQKSITENSS